MIRTGYADQVGPGGGSRYWPGWTPPHCPRLGCRHAPPSFTPVTKVQANFPGRQFFRCDVGPTRANYKPWGFNTRRPSMSNPHLQATSGQKKSPQSIYKHRVAYSWGGGGLGPTRRVQKGRPTSYSANSVPGGGLMGLLIVTRNPPSHNLESPAVDFGQRPEAGGLVSDKAI